VLSAGGTRGIAELGAIQAVREAAIPISCVVGTSVGALVGGLYASAPDQDTTQRFRELTQAYLAETENEARGRGWQAGALLGTLAATLSGGALMPAAAGALSGYLLGAATIRHADRARMQRVFRHLVGGARIEALPVAFATLHHERTGQGVTLVVDRTGDLAEAVGGSIANPFVFGDVDVTRDLKIDPGSDRVAATPVQDACRLFPNANLLVVNVSGTAAFHDATMRCPVREIQVEVAAPSPLAFFREGAEFEHAWRRGHDQVAMALAAR
jgi:NTE family protein